MRITFILNALVQCGGVNHTLQTAMQLAKRGHEIYIRYPYASPAQTTEVKVRRTIGGTLRRMGIMKEKEADWLDCNLDIKIVPSLNERYIPDADAVFATWWETAFDVRKYSRRKGDKYYFIQHYESLWATDKERADLSYKLGLKNVVNSEWTAGRVYSTGADVHGIAYAGVSPKFYPEDLSHKVDLSGNGITIGVAYRDMAWKGWEDLVKAFRFVQRLLPKAALIIYGQKMPPDFDPTCMDFWQSPSDDDLRHFYNLCDIFMWGSWYEGFASVPLETMRCIVPTCTTDVGIFVEAPHCGAFISPPRDPAKLAANVIYVLTHDVREEIKRAYKFACSFTWERTAKELEELL